MNIYAVCRFNKKGDRNKLSLVGKPVDRNVLLQTPELGIAGNQPGLAGDCKGGGETVGVGDGVLCFESAPATVSISP